MAANEAKIIVSADDQASKQLSGITDKAKAMRGAFLAVGAAGTAITGAIGLSVKTFAQAGDEVQKMALRTGLTTESLSELRFALEQSGSNIEGFEKGIRRMSSFIQDGRDGLTETTRAIETLGLSVSEFDGLSPEQAFETLSTALAGVEDDITQAALAQDIFGRSGTALLPLLAQGVDGINALKQEAHDLGIVFDQDAANSAARLVDAQNTLSKSFQGVQIALAEGLAPALSGFLEGSAKVISKLSEWAKENPVLTQVIVGFTGALGALAIALAGIGLVLPVIATGLGAVSVGFIGLNVATGGLLLAIGALGAGLVLLVKNWDTVVEAIRKGVNVLIGAAEFWVNNYVKAINKIIDAINMVGSIFGKTIENISEVELPRWQQAMKDTEETVTESGDEIVDQNDRIADSFTATAESAEDAAARIIQAHSDKVQKYLDDGKLMTDIDQRLRESQEAVMEGHLASAQAIVDASNERYRKIREDRERDLAHDLEIMASRADAAKALEEANRQAFEEIRRGVANLPSVMRGQQVAGASLAGFSLGGVSAETFSGFGANLVLNPIAGPGGAQPYGINQQGERVLLAINTNINVEGNAPDDFDDQVERALRNLVNRGAAEGSTV